MSDAPTATPTQSQRAHGSKPRGHRGRGLRRSLAAIVSVGLLASTVSIGTGTASASAPDRPAPTPRTQAALTVGTFNIHRGGSGLPMNGARLDRIASEIGRANYDVVGLQEANTDARKALLPRLGGVYDFSLMGDHLGRTTSGGLIFYKPSVLYPGKIQGQMPLPTPSWSNPRYGLYQDFYHRPSGAHFLFVTVHLSNLSGRASSDARNTQAQSLISQINEVNPNQLPLVLVGDMNSNHAKKYVYDAPRRVYEAQGLREVFDLAATKVNANFNSFNHLLTVPKMGGYRPDQIYVSPGISVSYAETMVRTVKRKMKVRKKNKTVRKVVHRYQTPFISDHNAIRATALIPGGQ